MIKKTKLSGQKLLGKQMRGLMKSAIPFLFIFVVFSVEAQFVHPGMSHKKSDLERMKYQVEKGLEPWSTSFQRLKSESGASYNYKVSGDPSKTEISNFSQFRYDGIAAYYNALMWYITGDERHAQKSVEIFNAWVNVKKVSSTMALEGGRVIWKMMEAAEIIKCTYDGWNEEDIQKFKDMLVYPGYSTTTEPTAAIQSKDVTFYWSMYNGDPGRHGNQGLFGIRGIMAMGIFMDNDIMYQRALRYLQGETHLPNDLPYPSGPPITSGRQSSSNEYYDEFRLYGRENTIEDYGYNEVIANYIWENGQGQESSRDQAHGLGGVSIITSMCEMAWNQGTDLYGHLDNRPLLGLEFYFRYNLSYEHSYPDQLVPWEPTIESGEFIQRLDRSGRWKSLKINPYTGADLTNWNRGNHNLNPIYEMNLGHYKYRMNMDASKTKWLERGFDVMTKELGVEDGANPVDHPGHGGLKFRRVTSGDPISGFTEGVADFDMNYVPGTIQAVNYDHFTLRGESRTYHDVDSLNTGGKYRLNDGVDIDTCSAGGYCLTDMEAGEWLTYTIAVPSSGLYGISLKYAAANGNGTIKFNVRGKDVTEELSLPYGEGFSNGKDDWQDYLIAEDVILSKGVQALKICISGESQSYRLKEIKIDVGSVSSCENPLSAKNPVSFIAPGINFAYYEGAFDSMPDFDELTPVQEGLTDSIKLISGLRTDSFAMVFSGYVNLPIDGEYLFYTMSDESARLYIDGNLVVDKAAEDISEEQSGSICLMEGFHEIKVEYIELNGDEELKVMYSGLGIFKRKPDMLYGIGTCENQAVALPENAVSGINFYYYEGEWTKIPDFSVLDEIDKGTISSISLSKAQASDYYAFLFEGYIYIDQDGDYTFYTASDDGSALYIDGERVVNNDGTHGVEEASGSLCLANGYHKIRVEYFEATGGNSISVKYAGDGISKQTLSNFLCVPVPEKRTQTITFEALPEKNVGDPEVILSAEASSGLPVTFSSYHPTVAQVINNIMGFLKEGRAIILVTQEGNAEYKPAFATQWQVVNARGTSLEIVSDNQVIIYPNPVADLFTLRKADSKSAKIEIINSIGKTVILEEIEGKEISFDVSTLQKGLYIVKTNTDGLIRNNRIIKQ